MDLPWILPKSIGGESTVQLPSVREKVLGDTNIGLPIEICEHVPRGADVTRGANIRHGSISTSVRQPVQGAY